MLARVILREHIQKTKDVITGSDRNMVNNKNATVVHNFIEIYASV